MKKTRTSPRFKQSLTHLPNGAPDSTATTPVVTHDNVDPYDGTEVRSSIKIKYPVTLQFLKQYNNICEKKYKFTKILVCVTIFMLIVIKKRIIGFDFKVLL